MTDAPATDIPRARLGPLRPPTEQPSPRAIWHWATQAALTWAILLAGLAAANLILDHPPGWLPTITTVAVLAAVLHVAIMPVWRYRVHRWELSDDAAYTRTGWISHHHRIVPASRVQAVDIQRHALQRLFGLATVHVSTTAHGGALSISGLRYAVAEQVAIDLTAIAKATPGDAT